VVSRWIIVLGCLVDRDKPGLTLAVAFFYSPGVAVRLVHALGVETQYTVRLLDEICESGQYRELSSQAALLRVLFPKHLHELMYTTPQMYSALMASRPSPTITVDSAIKISFAGEWIHRWRAHNSDVFLTFLPHWYSHLSQHLQSPSQDLSPASIATSPGCLALQAHTLRMFETFIHRSSNELPVHPTLTPRSTVHHLPKKDPLGQQTGRMQDSIHAMALLLTSGDGRPQGIEKAEKKIARTVGGVLASLRGTPPRGVPRRPGIVSEDTFGNRSSKGDVLGTPRSNSTCDVASVVSSRRSFACMRGGEGLVVLVAGVWEAMIKAAVKKTCVWEGQACFALCDLLERLLPVIDDALTKSRTLSTMDWSFWMEIIRRMLFQGENCVTQVRALGLLFNLWERCPNGMGWLLTPDTWEMFFCHWSTLVRCYFMNLICWRVCLPGQNGAPVDPYSQSTRD
jgi:Protein of unknown function (DUF1765)